MDHFAVVASEYLRDWSLITGRWGGLQNGREGMWSFTPMKRGDGKRFSRAEGGGTKSIGVTFTL